MADKRRVLVIDDEVLLARLLCMLFEKDGFEAIPAGSGPEGLRLAQSYSPEVIILDVMMPGMHGYEVCRRLRNMTDAIIVFVTVRGETEEIIRGLKVGADDYLVKPYTYEELSTRVMACLRRVKKGALPPAYRASGDLVFVTDPDRRLIFMNNKEMQLTPTEFKILRYLIKNQGKVLSQDAILTNAWGPEYIGSKDLLKQFIYRLRSKLEPNPKDPQFILTVRGSGYVFEANGVVGLP